MTAIHILGQIIFGGYFIYNGLKHFKDHGDYTAYASSQGVPAPGAAVYLTGVLLLLGGLGIFFNIKTEVALSLIAIFLAGVTPVMHPFWRLENPGERSSQKIAFLKNAALFGACLLMFGIVGK